MAPHSAAAARIHRRLRAAEAEPARPVSPARLAPDPFAQDRVGRFRHLRRAKLLRPDGEAQALEHVQAHDRQACASSRWSRNSPERLPLRSRSRMRAAVDS